MLGNNKCFVCILYRSKIHTKVNELLWFLYSNRAAEGKNLLPTSGSLHIDIRQAHYMAMIWKNAGENYTCLSTPDDVGWTSVTCSNHYFPVRCLNTPAPEAVLQLITCGCKWGCEGKCIFRKNNFPCSEMGGCLIFSCNNKTGQLRLTEDCDEWEWADNICVKFIQKYCNYKHIRLFAYARSNDSSDWTLMTGTVYHWT